MPINIRRLSNDTESIETIANLCDGDWDLSSQIYTLSLWLDANQDSLVPAEYVADVGFCWRRDARGGGASLDPATMKQMADLGVSLFLSEYPGFTDEDDSDETEQLLAEPANAKRLFAAIQALEGQAD